jgi:hypothetical protein
MARYNEILTGRHNRALQKHFSMKGGPPAPQLASEIMPVHPLMSGRENRYLEGWNHFWAAAVGIVGVASPAIRLANDIGTNVIAVVEKIVVGTVAADKIDISFQNLQPLVSGHVPNYPTLIPSTAIDGRSAASSGTVQSSLVMSSNTTVTGIGQLIHKRQSQAGVDIDIIGDEDQQIVMVPQTLLQIFSEAAAGTLFVSLVWRERFLEDSERS